MRFVDSHLHLGERDADSITAFADASHTLLLACGTDRKSSHDVLEVARAHPGRVKAFVGIHPSEAKKSGQTGWLSRALSEATGLGEVGLDPAYSSAGPRGTQMKLFLTQLEIAQKLGKPVQAHSRGAEREVVETLDGFSLRSVLMHWLQSDEVLPEAMKKGRFISFGPALLYSRKLQRMASKAPHDQVLTETDSPVAFGPLGEVHGPSLVPSVVFKLAEIWGLKFEDTRKTLVDNARRFLGGAEKG